MRVLRPPLEITEANACQEVLRAWIDRGMLSLSIGARLPVKYMEYKPSPYVGWAMLLSDVFHHVVDAIATETGRDKTSIQKSVKDSFLEVLRSDRPSRCGNIRKFDQPLAELPDPNVSNDDKAVEVVRMFLLPGGVRVLLLVGMWLPADEESVWGNILYDLLYLIASTLDPDRPETLRDTLSRKVISYIAKPTTEYSGEYYNNEAST